MIPSKEQLQKVAELETKIEGWLAKYAAAPKALKTDSQLNEKLAAIKAQLEQIQKAKASYGTVDAPLFKGIPLIDEPSGSVGYKAKNMAADVLCVQRILNREGYTTPIDGQHSSDLDKVIRNFQIDRAGCTGGAADAMIAPGGHTWGVLFNSKTLKRGSIKSRKEIAAEKAAKAAALQEEERRKLLGGVEIPCEPVEWEGGEKRKKATSLAIMQQFEGEEDWAATVGVTPEYAIAEVTKEWDLIDYSTGDIPLASIGIATLTFRVGFKLEARFAASSKLMFKEQALALGVDGEICGIGSIALAIQLPICQAGATARLIATAKAAGELLVSRVETKVGLDGLTGSIKGQLAVFIGAPAWMVSIYTAFGGDREDMFAEQLLGELEILKFSAPGYRNGELIGDFEFTKGDGIDTMMKPVYETRDMIMAAYNEIVEVLEWIWELLKDGVEFLLDCAEALVEFFMDPSSAFIDPEDVAKDKLFETACEKAIKSLEKDVDVMVRLKDMDEDKRYALIKDYVVRDEIVQHLWHELHDNKKVDARSIEKLYHQIAVNVSYMTIVPNQAMYYLGTEVRVKVDLGSDQGFFADKLKMKLLCNGKAVREGFYKGDVTKGVWSHTFIFSAISAEKYKASAEGAKWEFFAFLDMEGEIKDKEVRLDTKMLRKEAEKG